MYSIQIKEPEKVFMFKLSGFMTEEESKALLEEFEQKIMSINANEYSMVIDGSDVKAASQNLVSYMTKTLELITNTPFKRRFNIMPKSAVATSQVKRVGEQYHILDNTIIVDSYEEVLESLKNK